MADLTLVPSNSMKVEYLRLKDESVQISIVKRVLSLPRKKSQSYKLPEIMSKHAVWDRLSLEMKTVYLLVLRSSFSLGPHQFL